MVMVYTLQIRVTKEQREQLKERARRKGFGSMSEYLRFLGLEQDNSALNKQDELLQKVTDLHTELIEVKTNKPRKNSAVIRR